jgi:hypothetical protein
VPGVQQNGSSGYRHLGLNSGYSIAGFNLSGFYNLGSSNTSSPELFGSQTLRDVNSDDHSFGFSATHRLPMQGSFSTSFNRSSMNTDYLGSHYNGTVDTLNANAGFHPTEKFGFSVSSGYSDNLTGSLFQTIVPGGQTSQPGDQNGGGLFQNSSESSHSFFLQSYGTYLLTKKLQLDFQAERRQQSYLGGSYGSNMYGGGASYVSPLFGGFLGVSLNLLGSNSDYSTGNVLSFTSNVNFSRTFTSWVVTGNFSYAQNVQTVLITYMNSFYTYSGSIRHPLFNRLVWSASASGSRTALTNDPHTGNGSHSYSTAFSSRHFSVNGSYAKSDGYGLLGGAGLIQPQNVPPGGIPPNWLIMYGGHSYSFGMGTTPVRNLSIGAAFSRAWSDTSTGGVGSNNKVEQLNTILNYRLRKLTFTAGYGRLLQGFSTSGLPPADVNSFSVGLSRSFNFF